MPVHVKYAGNKLALTYEEINSYFPSTVVITQLLLGGLWGACSHVLKKKIPGETLG